MKTKLIATTVLTLAGALAALSAGSASAQSVRPGLWEIRTSGPGGANGKAMAEHMARMKKEIAAMPAQQRKAVEAAMAAQDANDVRFTDDGMSMKHCMTREEASLDKLLVRQGSCTTQRSPMIGGVVKMNTSCTTPPMTGNGMVRFQGDTGYSMEMTMTTRVQGQTHTSKVNSTGKWLGSDCGKIKPAAAAPQLSLPK